MNNGPRLIAYIRVSRTMDRAGDSFQAPGQQRDAIGHAVALAGGTIVEEITDLNESGGTMNRPGLNKARQMLRHGAADGIVVARLDRFGRTLDVPIVIDELEAAGHRFISATDNFDTQTSVGRFALGLMVLVARLERDRHTETWAASTRGAIERGVAIRVPFGYGRGEDGRLVPVEPAASVVRGVFCDRAAGIGVADITRRLNSGGVSPAYAGAWTRQTVRAMTRVRTYLGEAKYAGNVNLTAHEALVTPELFAAAQRPASPSNAVFGDALLTGLVRCAGCGYVMGSGTSKQVRRYSCNRHHGGGDCPAPTAATAHLVESHATAAFLGRYGDVRARGAATGREVAAAERAMQRRREEFAWWRDSADVRDTVGTADYLAGLASRRAAMDDAERAHAVTVRKNGAQDLVVDLAAWAAMTTPERRALMHAGIDAIWLRRAASTHAPIASRCDVVFVGDERGDRPVNTQGRAGQIRPMR